MSKPSDNPLLSFSAVKRWPSPSAKRWAVSSFRNLASLFGTNAIVGIGSAVRSTHHPGSDVDFLVISDVQIEQERLPPIDVDLHLFRTSEVEQKLADCNDILSWALRYGQAIFERHRYWANLHAKWINQLSFPSPEVSLERALRFEHFARELISTGDLEAALEQVVGMLTHRSRQRLLSAHIYPASRPELPIQLREIGESRLAEMLERALWQREIDPIVLSELNRGTKESVQTAS